MYITQCKMVVPPCLIQAHRATCKLRSNPIQNLAARKLPIMPRPEPGTEPARMLRSEPGELQSIPIQNLVESFDRSPIQHQLGSIRASREKFDRAQFRGLVDWGCWWQASLLAGMHGALADCFDGRGVPDISPSLQFSHITDALLH